jgi:hypothetical protein
VLSKSEQHIKDYRENMSGQGYNLPIKRKRLHQSDFSATSPLVKRRKFFDGAEKENKSKKTNAYKRTKHISKAKFLKKFGLDSSI